jgi:hypothetical protein
MSDDEPQTLTLVALPYREALRLNRSYKNGEPEGTEFFDELRATEGECFLCAAPLSPGEGACAIMTDPAAKTPGTAMIGRQCDSCGSQTFQWRLNRLIKIFKAMHKGWHATRPSWSSR